MYCTTMFAHLTNGVVAVFQDHSHTVGAMKLEAVTANIVLVGHLWILVGWNSKILK